MNKGEIKKSIESHQQNIINELIVEYDLNKVAAEIDNNGVRDIDSQSHQSQFQDNEQLVSNRIESVKEALSFLKRIPLKESKKVELGSLIETESFLIYVGLVTQKFTDNGKDIIGISTDAPIYNKLKGQTVDYSFEIDGGSNRIVSIH